jgi:4-diphosphocytidyl-2-C-methyl-D-erythritol kinase
MIVREKVPAKINLTLDVLGVEGKFHKIESLVASIDIYDAITLLKRNDRRVTLKTFGLPIGCSMHDNNAVKAAQLFIKTFSTKGVNIIINKRIPVGGGLGGSSADIAAVLRGMKKLYNVDCDLKPLADQLGSDATYMLDGGYAIIRGRGTEVERIEVKHPLNLLVISSQGEISAKTCYGKYDELGVVSQPCTADAVKLLKSGKVKDLGAIMKNDLQPAAESLVDIRLAKLALEEVGAIKASVSGSGPTVFGVFKNREQRDQAFKRLSPLFRSRVIKANTITTPIGGN